jgi:3-deoxy-D-manno-octulosonate 8-phosphate phosphatase (KDO 8-P phosphatase)
MNSIYIDTVIFDMDGVLTDGKYHISEFGEITKTYSVYDMNALRELSKHYEVILLTHSQKVHQHFFNRLHATGEDVNITFYRVPYNQDKIHTLHKLVESNYTLYVGDSMQDFECMKAAAVAYFPKTAEKQLRKAAKGYSHIHKINLKGGNGIAAYIRDLLIGP